MAPLPAALAAKVLYGRGGPKVPYNRRVNGPMPARKGERREKEEGKGGPTQTLINKNVSTFLAKLCTVDSQVDGRLL